MHDVACIVFWKCTLTVSIATAKLLFRVYHIISCHKNKKIIRSFSALCKYKFCFTSSKLKALKRSATKKPYAD